MQLLWDFWPGLAISGCIFVRFLITFKNTVAHVVNGFGCALYIILSLFSLQNEARVHQNIVVLNFAQFIKFLDVSGSASWHFVNTRRGQEQEHW